MPDSKDDVKLNDLPNMDSVEEFLQITDAEEGFQLENKPKGLIILLHGFDEKYPDKSLNPAIDITPFFNKVRRYYQPKGYIVYAPIFPTNISFVRGGEFLLANIKNQQFPLNNVHMFGYSMGGLVCRYLAANGITPKSLTTYCTPHKGTALWAQYPFLNDGASSMMMASDDLKKLNNNSVDKACRERYTTIAISYEESNTWPVKYHENDQLIEVSSALMLGMEPAPAKPIHWLSYRKWPWGFGAVHADAQRFPMVKYCFEILRQNIGH